MTTQLTELYTKLNALIETGDETAVRRFLIDHLKEFPEDLQKRIIFETFAEALDKKVEIETNIAQIKEEGVQAIKEIEKVEGKLKDQQKLAELRANLGM